MLRIEDSVGKLETQYEAKKGRGLFSFFFASKAKQIQIDELLGRIISVSKSLFEVRADSKVTL